MQAKGRFNNEDQLMSDDDDDMGDRFQIEIVEDKSSEEEFDHFDDIEDEDEIKNSEFAPERKSSDYVSYMHNPSMNVSNYR